MTLYLVVVVATYSALVFRYHRAWSREYKARLAIHRARILDNDRWAADNERWQERERKVKRLAFEAGYKWGWNHTPLKDALALERLE